MIRKLESISWILRVLQIILREGLSVPVASYDRKFPRKEPSMWSLSLEIELCLWWI